MQAYKGVFLASFKAQCFYKKSTMISILVAVIGILMMRYLWEALYAEETILAGLSLSQMYTYSSLSWFFGIFEQMNPDRKITQKIRSGDISLELIKPYNYGCALLAELWGEVSYTLMIKGLPILLISYLIFHISYPKNFSTYFFTIVSVVLGASILFLFNFSFALIAFWSIEMQGFNLIKNLMISILSGLIIPLWYFPEVIQEIAGFLPFQYIFQVPISIYIEKIKTEDILPIIFLQILWLLLLFAVNVLVWNFIKKKLLIQGG